MPEDTGYKVDVSVAAFKKITSQNKVNLYYGDSTGFSKTINPELDRNGAILMAGASFATELNNPAKYPNQFLVGPDYTEMFGILLKHIAKEKPGAKVAFVYSDSEFGRDPIEASEAAAKKLGLNVVAKLMTPPGSVDVSTEVIKLRRAAPDYTIFHGYILAPIPEFIQQGKQMGMTSQWMGTFWTMDSSTVMKMGEAGDGFMGVMPYRYYYDTSAKAPMLDKIDQGSHRCSTSNCATGGSASCERTHSISWRSAQGSSSAMQRSGRAPRYRRALPSGRMPTPRPEATIRHSAS